MSSKNDMPRSIRLSKLDGFLNHEKRNHSIYSTMYHIKQEHRKQIPLGSVWNPKSTKERNREEK